MRGNFKAVALCVGMAGAGILGWGYFAQNATNGTDPLQGLKNLAEAGNNKLQNEKFEIGNAWRNFEFNVGRALCHCAPQ